MATSPSWPTSQGTRMVAVDTATRQGWSAARYLELQSLEDDGTAPPHVLLAAMKHSRQVEKAEAGAGTGRKSPKEEEKAKRRGRKARKGKERTKEGRPLGANGAPARRRRPPSCALAHLRVVPSTQTNRAYPTRTLTLCWVVLPDASRWRSLVWCWHGDVKGTGETLLGESWTFKVRVACFPCQ